MIDLHAATQRPGRAGPAAPASAARAAGGARLGVGAQRRDVPATVGRLDQRDDRALQDEVAELHAKQQERPEAQAHDGLVELQERRRPEGRVLGHLEIFQGDRGKRQKADRHARELHRAPEALAGRRGDQRLNARRVDETRNGDEHDDDQDHDDRDDGQQPDAQSSHRPSRFTPAGSRSA